MHTFSYLDFILFDGCVVFMCEYFYCVQLFLFYIYFVSLLKIVPLAYSSDDIILNFYNHINDVKS